MGKEVKMEATASKKGKSKKVQTEEKVKYEFLDASELVKLSDEDLKAKLDEMNKIQEDYGKNMASKLYSVKLESQSNLSLLKKWVEKETKWNHNTVPTLVAMYDGLKKAIDAGIDEDGNAQLSTIVVANIYQYLLTFEGKGYLDAKKYLTLLTKVGGPISEAMKELADDNEYFRNLHTDLSTIDQAMQAKAQGIDIAKSADKSSEGESSEGE